jgi:ubiquinone/menaquinone biosynthesis C-methylase UbiE
VPEQDRPLVADAIAPARVGEHLLNPRDVQVVIAALEIRSAQHHLLLRIEIAKRKARSNLSFAVDDAFALDSHSDASFDVVYLNAVFHGFLEKLRPLRNFQRRLKSGGRLGIATGAKEYLKRIHDLQLKVLAREPYRSHVQPAAGLPKRVSRDELAELLEQARSRTSLEYLRGRSLAVW